MSVSWRWRVGFGGIGDPASRSCDQIHLIRREFHRRFGLSAESNLPLHQPRPSPNPARHGQAAGLTERREIVPHLEFRPTMAVEP